MMTLMTIQRDGWSYDSEDNDGRSYDSEDTEVGGDDDNDDDDNYEDIEVDDDDDEDADDDCDNEETQENSSDNGDQSCAVDRDERKRCFHFSSHLRKICFKDSYLIINSSLAKASDSMIDSLQKSNCELNCADGIFASIDDGSNSHINIGERKLCQCSKDKHYVMSECLEVTNFAKICLGDMKHVDHIFSKLRAFPYAVLDLGVEGIKAMN